MSNDRSPVGQHNAWRQQFFTMLIAYCIDKMDKPNSKTMNKNSHPQL